MQTCTVLLFRNCLHVLLKYFGLDDNHLHDACCLWYCSYSGICHDLYIGCLPVYSTLDWVGYYYGYNETHFGFPANLHY